MDTMKDTTMQHVTDVSIVLEAAAEFIAGLLERIEQLESDLATAEQDSRQKQARIERLEATETAWKVSDKSCYDLTEKVIPNIREKLEAAEKDIALKEKIIDSLGVTLTAVVNERDELRANIEQMEKQEPAGTLHDDGCFVWSPRCRPTSNYVGWKMKLYTLPGAKGE